MAYRKNADRDEDKAKAYELEQVTRTSKHDHLLQHCQQQIAVDYCKTGGWMIASTRLYIPKTVTPSYYLIMIDSCSKVWGQ